MRDYIPEGYDEHLLTLEMLVRAAVKENNLCLDTLMGQGPPSRSRHPSADEDPAAGGLVAAAVVERQDTYQFSAKVPTKKLRCLKL